MIATSDDWGAVKPDVPFFRAVIDSAPCDASGIVYVGDQVDNDLKPAKPRSPVQIGVLSGVLT